MNIHKTLKIKQLVELYKSLKHLEIPLDKLIKCILKVIAMPF